MSGISDRRHLSPTPFPVLNAVLVGFRLRVQRALDQNLIGVYLQGSAAVGGFDEHSDVDFIVVTTGDLSASHLGELQSAHHDIYGLESEWARHLEGSYFPAEVIRDHAKHGSELWYLDHGANHLVRSDHCNTVLVRWILRERGVVLTGPEPSTLVDPITTLVLRQDILRTINTWGADILAHPEQYRNHFYQTYIVLNLCRMLHDLRRGSAGSKRDGAEWAKNHLEEKWSGLIDRAWDGRPDPAASVRRPANPDDFRLTLELVQVIIDAANGFAESEGLFGGAPGP